MFTFPMCHFAGAAANPATFKTGGYTGTGADQSFSGFGFQPDLIITKRSSGGNQAWNLQDSTRGISASLTLDSSGAELTGLTDYVTVFGADGFTVGANALVNNSGSSYQYWGWKKTSLVMDIVAYTGNGSNRTINHNLGATPNFIIVKRRNATALWTAYHDQLASAAQNNYNWNAAAGMAVSTDSTVWNDTAPTSSVFSVGTSNLTNANTSTYIAYLFANVAGSVSFGKYTGNGSTSGPSVSCGFQPTTVIIFRSAGTGRSIPIVYSSTESMTFTDVGTRDTTNFMDFVASGFNIKTNSSNYNTSALEYQYCAFK